MSYEPTTWVTGDIITATKLNNIESGVQSVSSSYAPTTWTTGDIITATKLNNIEQGIANAGGGSSDFSTAQVTIVNESGYNRILSMPVYYAAEDDEPAFMNAYLNMFPNGTVTVDVAVPIDGKTEVYSGETGDKLQGVQMGSTLTVTSGSATQASNNRVTITGDCTITIS